mgnify:CR=1 FL=1
MNILVTGATGFIGSHLVRKLLNLQHKVFISVRPSSNTSRINNISDKLIKIDIDSSLNGIHETFKKNKIDGIIHLATYYRKEDSTKEIENMNNINIIFPTRLLNMAKEHGISFFINTGTCFEYAPSLRHIDENSIIKPFNYYALTKFKFEEKLIKSTKGSSLKAFTLKLFFPYGEQDNNKLIKLLIESLILKREFHVTKGGQYLSYTYVEDIVNAFILALNHILIAQNNYDIFNIGGAPIKVSNIFDILEEISAAKGLIARDKEYPQNEIMSMFTNSEKAKKELGWKQKWSLKEGLQKTYSYYLTHY